MRFPSVNGATIRDLESAIAIALILEMQTVPSTASGHGLRHKLRSPKTFFLIALNGLLYFLLFRWAGENIDPGRVADYFTQIPLWAPIGSLLINMAALCLYGVRMALLLGTDFRTAFSIVNMGYALNTLLPLRLGEGIKVYLGYKLFAVPMTATFAGSIAEKLMDLVKILLLGVVVLVFAAGEIIQVSALWTMGLLAFLGIGVVAIFGRKIVRIVRFFPKHSRLRRIFIQLHKHARGYPLDRIVLLTAAIGVLNVFLVFFTFNTYLPDVRLGAIEAIALLVVIALAIAIPSAPAGVGLFEAGIVVYLTQKSNIGIDAALAAASVFHLVITIPQLIVTAWLVWRRSPSTAEGSVEKAG